MEQYDRIVEFENLDKTGMSIEEINKLYKEYTGDSYYFPFNPYAGDGESEFSYFSEEYKDLYKQMYEDGTLPGYCNKGEFWK